MRLRRLIWGFAGRRYDIVANLTSWFNYDHLWLTNHVHCPIYFMNVRFCIFLKTIAWSYYCVHKKFLPLIGTWYHVATSELIETSLSDNDWLKWRRSWIRFSDFLFFEIILKTFLISLHAGEVFMIFFVFSSADFSPSKSTFFKKNPSSLTSVTALWSLIKTHLS